MRFSGFASRIKPLPVFNLNDIRKSALPAGLILLAVIVLAGLSGKDKADSPAPLDLAFSTTPTPCPLPVQAATSQPRILTILQQLFSTRQALPEPAALAAVSRLEAQNGFFDLYSTDGYLPVDLSWWQEESSRAARYVSARIGTPPGGKVQVLFLPPRSGNCAPRGTSFHEDPPVILIFADQDTSREQILAVLAHELGHILIHDTWPDLHDLALQEGLAAWAAGKYWESWQGSDLDSSVSASIGDGTYLPLFRNYYLDKAFDSGSAQCLADRDALLTEMASLLDYVIRTYSMDSLQMLLETRPPYISAEGSTRYPADYAAVYGLELNQLEIEWLNSLPEIHPVQ